MKKDNCEIDCLGMLEADREYAINRLKTVYADSIRVIEGSDRIDISIIKHREPDINSWGEDYTTPWLLWQNLERSVTEFVAIYGPKDVVYYDDAYELCVDVTGGKPDYREVHYLEMPWFEVTTSYRSLRKQGQDKARGVGFSNHIKYCWTIRTRVDD